MSPMPMTSQLSMAIVSHDRELRAERLAALRGKAEGEFDQVVWVTMKDPEPVIANLLLDGIEDKNVRNRPLPKPATKTADAK